jgi:hypothetical protein
MHYKRFDFPGCPLAFTNHVKHSAGCGAHEALPLRASYFDQRAWAAMGTWVSTAQWSVEHFEAAR